MKKLFIYILTTVLLVACSSENIIENTTNEATTTVEKDRIERELKPGVYVVMPMEMLTGETESSRSSLSYDYNQKKMIFDWESDDVGVFATATGVSPDIPSNKAQQRFTQEDSNENATNLYRRFIGPDAVEVLHGGSTYIACKPYFQDVDKGYSAIPVTYAGQSQKASVDVSLYPFNGKLNAMTAEQKSQYMSETLPHYHESEALASAHLGDYDYTATNPTTAGVDGHIVFYMNRLGSVVRFYIRVPAPVVYDSLQLVNKDVKFTINANLNLGNISNPFVPTLQKNVISLNLKEKKGAEVEPSQGIDFSNTSDEKKYWNGTGYLIAYMMLAPIDLSGVGTENCTLYLCGHEGGTPKYYKSTLSTKPNLTPNIFYQWSPTSNPDEPITFEAIEIEKWKEEVAPLLNGGGKGTGTW